jgi:UDP-2,3-diacylglucosamine pyrophosphatase LpxH
MPRNKTVFVSDVHMGGSPDYDWLGRGNRLGGSEGRREFAEFLASVETDQTVAELVLVGDVLDNWVWPHLDEAPPTFNGILNAEANQAVVTALQHLLAEGNVRVTYVQGNHDMDAWGDLESLLRSTFQGLDYEKTGIGRGPLWAEHGSRHAMFTARDFANDPIRGLPLGYFITRVNESRATKSLTEQTVGSVTRAAFEGFMESHNLAPEKGLTLTAWSADQAARVRESFITNRLAGWVFAAIVRWAGRSLSDTIVLPIDGTCTLGDIKERYQDLFRDWDERLGFSAALRALRAELDHMAPVAHDEAEKRHASAVLFGHSHQASLEDSSPAYLNDGCFLRDGSGGNTRNPHFVEVFPTDGGLTARAWSLRKTGNRVAEGEVVIR